MVNRGSSSIAIIGDLMGKGLPAAMWLTHSIDLIHRAAERNSDLSSMMAEWNRELVQSRVGAPLTTAVAVEISHDSNRLSYVAAGHPPALLARGSYIETLAGDAPILGAFRDAQFPAKEILLDPDDVLLAYSDGVSEARNVEDKEFSVDGLTGSLRATTGMPLASRVSRLLSDVVEYCDGRFLDDVSVLAIERQ
jgi:sigma-B regulation protein RsbU (phosphoserine phosphatase)